MSIAAGSRRKQREPMAEEQEGLGKVESLGGGERERVSENGKCVEVTMEALTEQLC